MGLKEDLGELWPEGDLEIENPEELEAAVAAAGTRLSDERYAQLREGLAKALTTQQRQKETLAILRFALEALGTLT